MYKLKAADPNEQFKLWQNAGVNIWKLKVSGIYNNWG